ncbi:surface-adhesin E family protein [Neisseria bacilliformis]|jgi:hypothetical protein|uniref:surface-adhesin E family protein n=1 Tax=Neisseria bacilliformis TaxID=267212 RepID=UPI000A5E2EC4|nr:surface-adhesin E family protein [Neisseria bacilliformis]
MEKILISAIFLFVSNAVQAANWVKIASSNQAVNYMDLSEQGFAVSQFSNGSGTYLSAWIKTVLKTPKHLQNGKAFNLGMAKYYFDCNRKKMQMGQGMLYNHTEVVDRFNTYVDTYSSDSWADTAPDTVNKAMLTEICKIPEIAKEILDKRYR